MQKLRSQWFLSKMNSLIIRIFLKKLQIEVFLMSANNFQALIIHQSYFIKLSNQAKTQKCLIIKASIVNTRCINLATNTNIRITYQDMKSDRQGN